MPRFVAETAVDGKLTAVVSLALRVRRGEVERDHAIALVIRSSAGLFDLQDSQASGDPTVWMIQRPLDAYRALEPADRQRVDEALRGTGCEALFERPPRHRLGKSGIELVFAPSARQNARPS